MNRLVVSAAVAALVVGGAAFCPPARALAAESPQARIERCVGLNVALDELVRPEILEGIGAMLAALDAAPAFRDAPLDAALRTLIADGTAIQAAAGGYHASLAQPAANAVRRNARCPVLPGEVKVLALLAAHRGARHQPATSPVSRCAWLTADLAALERRAYQAGASVTALAMAQLHFAEPGGLAWAELDRAIQAIEAGPIPPRSPARQVEVARVRARISKLALCPAPALNPAAGVAP